MAKNTMMVMVDKIVASRERSIRSHSRQFTLDLVTLALGRMGFREKRLSEFRDMLIEVEDEYSRLIVDDVKDDIDIVYSKYKMDEELQIYCGSIFAPYDERYSNVL